MALMITRRPGESLYIAGGIVVTFVEHRRGEEIRLAITAPSGVRVDRLELAFRANPALYDEWCDDGTRRYPGTGAYARALPRE